MSEKYDDDGHVDEQMEQARDRGLFKNLKIKEPSAHHVYPINDFKEHFTDGRLIGDSTGQPTLIVGQNHYREIQKLAANNGD